jgi:hypothetical protein
MKESIFCNVNNITSIVVTDVEKHEDYTYVPAKRVKVLFGWLGHKLVEEHWLKDDYSMLFSSYTRYTRKELLNRISKHSAIFLGKDNIVWYKASARFYIKNGRSILNCYDTFEEALASVNDLISNHGLSNKLVEIKSKK